MKPYSDEEMIAWERRLPSKIMNAALAIHYQGEVLMVKASYKDHWTFPSGVIDLDESPLHAAIRETKEEVGIAITPSQCHLLKVVYTSATKGHRDRLSFAFVTHVAQRVVVSGIPNEEITEARWVPISSIAHMSNNKATYIAYQATLEGDSPPPYAEHS